MGDGSNGCQATTTVSMGIWVSTIYFYGRVFSYVQMLILILPYSPPVQGGVPMGVGIHHYVYSIFGLAGQLCNYNLNVFTHGGLFCL